MGYGKKAFDTIVQYFASEQSSSTKDERVRLLSKQVLILVPFNIKSEKKSRVVIVLFIYLFI